MDEAAVVETVRRAEVVRAGTEVVAVRRARLQRVVVRETRTVEVEVAHEEYRVVYDDVEADGPLGSAPEPRSASVVLHEERIEVVRRVVPVERVTLTLVPVTEEATVTAAVRHEVVEVEQGVLP